MIWCFSLSLSNELDGDGVSRSRHLIISQHASSRILLGDSTPVASNQVILEVSPHPMYQYAAWSEVGVVHRYKSPHGQTLRVPPFQPKNIVLLHNLLFPEPP